MAKEEKEKKGSKSSPKPVGTGNTRLKFDEKPKIWPTDDASKTNPKMETSLFDDDALGSEIPATSDYAAGSKKEYFQKGVFDHKMPNTISPTTDY